jgi:hypothetical protein
MKIKFTILAMLFSAQLFAQRMHGIVLDKFTGLAIPNGVIQQGNIVKLSSPSGDFYLPIVHFGDTVRISSMGFKPYKYVVGMRIPDTVKIYLEEGTVMLNNVTVNAQRNTRLDSANVRKEFAKIFAYKPPVFQDAFLTYDPYEYKPDNYITSGHSTASLVGIDLMTVASLFGAATNHKAHVRDIALKNEDITYVDTRFSKKLIISTTNLQGDDLRHFMEAYRPAIDDIKKMSDYDLIVYIKKCYAQFMKH